MLGRIGVIVLAILLVVWIIAVAESVNGIFKSVERYGVKGTLTQLWCGEEGCK